MLSMVWMTAALAGAPKTLPFRDHPTAVPSTAVPVESIMTRPMCATWKPGSLPTIEVCPDAVEALVTAPTPAKAATPATSDPSVRPIDAERFGGHGSPVYVAGEFVSTATWSWTLSDLGGLDDKQVGAVSEWCRRTDAVGVITSAVEGCSVTTMARTFDASKGGIATKDIEVLTKAGEGSFAIEGARSVGCSVSKIILIDVTPKAELCAAVLPRALALGDKKVATVTARVSAPIAAASSPTADVFGGIAKAKADGDSISTSLTSADAHLAQARLDLAAVRDIVNTSAVSDNRFISLLTRLEELESDISEATVSSAGLQARLAGLRTETANVQENASKGGAEAMFAQQIAFDVKDLQGRMDVLRDDTNTLTERISKAVQGIGYLQGGFATMNTPAEPKKR